MDLHRRARVDTALAVDRRHGARRPARRPDLLQVALRLCDRAVLVDPLDPGRLRGDQVRERGDHGAHGRSLLPARADAREPPRGRRRRARLRCDPGDGLRDLDRLGRARLPVLRALLVARRPRAPLEGPTRRRARDRGGRRRLLRPPEAVHEPRPRPRPRCRRALADRPPFAASSAATGRAATRSARSRSPSARCSSSTASSSSTSTSGSTRASTRRTGSSTSASAPEAPSRSASVRCP